MKDNHKACCLSASEMKFYQDFVNNPGGHAGNFTKLYKFTAPVDVDQLAEAISVAINAHKAFSLRIFLNENGEPRQYIDTDYIFTQAVEVMSDEQFSAEQQHIVGKFRLFDEPLFHSRLIQTPSAVYWFCEINHVIMDSNSLLILYNDVTKAYNGEELPMEDWTPCDIAEYEMRNESTETFRASVETLKDEWRECEGCYPIPDIHEKLFSIKKKFATLDIDLNAIRTFTDATGCSLSALSAAACSLLLAFSSGNRNAALVTGYNCRNKPQVERTFAMVTKYLLFTVPFDKSITPSEFALRAMNATSDGRSNVDGNLTAIKELNMDFANFMPFIFQGSMLGKIIRPFIANQQAENVSLSLSSNTDLKPFNVHFMFSDGKPKIMILCHGNKYSDALIDKFADNFQTILRMLPTAGSIGEIMDNLKK